MMLVFSEQRAANSGSAAINGNGNRIAEENVSPRSRAHIHAPLNELVGKKVARNNTDAFLFILPKHMARARVVLGPSV